MVQRAFYYAAGTVMICAIGAASLQLAAQILSFSSPLADAAAALAAAAILGNSLRRHMRTAAKHLPARSARMAVHHQDAARAANAALAADQCLVELGDEIRLTSVPLPQESAWRARPNPASCSSKAPTSGPIT